ncbi:MAG: 4-hydroxy-3-methylbut-2-enyl diphosphate reductase [Synergistaceae bacterium]|jgi:4-hydroxy-3-methylbut-2-enyl diphosphate reductase|nr:4-hydroxy-3-methylbut-2-enyl diphosphate reductase [Synergistaceae bacterium]
MREVIVAEQAGFCFGVKRAVDEIVKVLTDEGAAWSIGMPIHNPQEVSRLQAMGLKIARDAAEVPDGARVFVRAHGEPRAVIQGLRARGAKVSDMTCPFVRRAQERASELSSRGYRVVLLGDVLHPEIRAIMGNIEGAADVVAGVEDARKLPKAPRVALISQTTQREELLAEVASALVLRAGELHVCNTVCGATVERQDAVRRLAGRVDGLVVVGGKESANTAKLRDIGEAGGMDVVWIENIGEMDWRWLDGKAIIGIAAGASTPQGLITEVCDKIARM